MRRDRAPPTQRPRTRATDPTAALIRPIPPQQGQDQDEIPDGTTTLMSVSRHNAPSDPEALFVLCPICKLPASSTVIRRQELIITSTSVCPMEHLWETRWIDVNPLLTRENDRIQSRKEAAPAGDRSLTNKTESES